jgi:hypothetical protein
METPPTWGSTLALLLQAPTLITAVRNFLEISHFIELTLNTYARIARFRWSITQYSFVLSSQLAKRK